MKPLLTPLRIEIAAWAALFGGLAVGLGLETDWGSQIELPIADSAAAPAEFSAPPLAEPFHLPAADEFLEIAMRPIFVITRRPAPAAPPPEPPKPAMQRDQFTLLGVTIVPEGKFAFVLEKATKKNRVLNEGSEVNGMKITSISPDQVVLSQYDEVEVLTLKSAKGPATPPADATAKPAQLPLPGVRPPGPILPAPPQ